jgi:hypothetical protein
MKIPSWLGRVEDFVQRVANLYVLWLAVASAATAVFAWGASQVPWLAAQGLAAVLLAAFLCFFLLLLALSLVYIAYAKYARASGSTVVLGPLRLYVGQTHVSADKLEEDLCLEIAIVGYNASDFALSVNGITGSIRCNGGTVVGETPLPVPVLLTDRTNTTNIPPYSEIFLVCEQRVPRTVAQNIHEAFKSCVRVAFDMRALDIVLSAIPEPSHRARLPLTGGFTLEKKEGIFVGGINHAAMRTNA